MTDTTTATTPTTEQRAAVLQHHANGRSVDMICALTHLDPTDVETILTTANQAKPRPTTPRGEHLEGLVSLPIDQVHPSPNNPRERLTDIDELAASIKDAGLIQPLVVQPIDYGYQIVAGHRRYAAMKALGRLSIECIVRRTLRPDEELLAMLIENGQRAGLDPIEEGRALNRLKIQQGISENEVARRIGRPLSFVTGRIMLLSLPVDEQEMVRVGVTTMTEAKVKARVASGRIRPNAIGRSAAGHLSADHPLAERAKNACVELRHSRGKGVGVGGIACGQCWEAVIRANEREKIQAASAVAGRCLICGNEHDQAPS